jgi:hypothetical protein
VSKAKIGLLSVDEYLRDTFTGSTEVGSTAPERNDGSHATLDFRSGRNLRSSQKVSEAKIVLLSALAR